MVRLHGKMTCVGWRKATEALESPVGRKHAMGLVAAGRLKPRLFNVSILVFLVHELKLFFCYCYMLCCAVFFFFSLLGYAVSLAVSVLSLLAGNNQGLTMLSPIE